jgi:predicted nucleotidyltransferase
VEHDVGPYVEHWRRTWERDAEEARARAARAREAVPALVRLLAGEYGARRVWLIGSLARGGFGQRSDIDLVAEGVPPGRFFEACAVLDRAGDPFPVDLVPLEQARPFVRELLARGEGELWWDVDAG